MVRYKCWPFLTWLMCSSHGQMWVLGLSDMVDVFIPWSDVSAEPFLHGWCVHPMVRYKCWAFLTWLMCSSSHGQMWVLGLSDMMCSSHDQMWVLDLPFWHGGGCVPPMVRCKCWAGLSDWVKYKCWRRWRPTWRLGLQPAWKRVGSVELPMTRIER